MRCWALSSERPTRPWHERPPTSWLLHHKLPFLSARPLRTSSTMTMAVTAQGVEMFLPIGSSPRLALLVGQAGSRDEGPRIRSGRHRAIAAHLSYNKEVVRIGMVVDLPVVLRDRVESRQPLLRLRVAI